MAALRAGHCPDLRAGRALVLPPHRHRAAEHHLPEVTPPVTLLPASQLYLGAYAPPSVARTPAHGLPGAGRQLHRVRRPLKVNIPPFSMKQ